jgi:TonB family protein
MGKVVPSRDQRERCFCGAGASACRPILSPHLGERFQPGSMNTSSDSRISVLSRFLFTFLLAIALAAAAAAQIAPDSAGVTVDTGGAPLLHRSPVQYPESAVAARIEGTVAVSVRVDGNGEVIDASAVSGPEKLRGAVLQSVLNWHFAQAAANSTRQVSVSFQAAAAPKPGRTAASIAPPVKEPQTLTLNVYGLSDAARAELLSRLPVREGDTIATQEQLQKVFDSVHAFDEHLQTSVFSGASGEMKVSITAPGSSPSASAAWFTGPTAPPAGAAFAPPPGTVTVKGEVEAANLLTKVTPVYPPLAKQAQVSGSVTLTAFIGADGTVKNLSVVKGHPLLIAAAIDAVKQWVYKPTLLNGLPVPVITTIEVNFTLSQ